MHRLDQLFPIDPLTLVAALRRLESKILLYAPELTTSHCNRLLGELSITDGLLSRLTAEIRRGPEWQRRMALPEIDAGLSQVGLLPEPKRRRWRAAAPRVKYPRPSSPAATRVAATAAEVADERHSEDSEALPRD